MTDKSLEERLGEVLALIASATPGEWQVLGDNQGHPCGLEWTIECPELADEDYTGWIAGRHGGDGIATTGNPGDERDATAIVEAVNFLRQHGETILSALADQRRLREAAIYYETNFRSCMERLDAIAEQIDEADEEGRGFVPSHILATILAGPETRPEHPDYAALPLPEKAEVES